MEREELTERRRVKLYLLNEENEWDDGGTGYVAVVMAQNQSDMNLLVNSETDSSALLDTKIDIDVAYQKQQDTLIVWFDNEAQNNLALSFQEAAGCDEIWAKICQIHGKPASVKSTGDEELDGSPKDGSQGGQQRNGGNRMSTGASISLPPCDLGHLDDLLTSIRDNSRMPNRREKLAIAIETGGYINKLATIFRMAEDLESSEILVKLYEIIKLLFHLNRSSLLDIMLADQLVMDVVGMLEYDPTLKEQAGHRRFLLDRARFHQVLPIKNKELLAKIERTFRLQYIQDVVQPLPLTILDTDTTLSALSSQIYFNKMDIVMSIQTDGPFLEQLFRQLLSSTYCDDITSPISSAPEDSNELTNSQHTSVAGTPTELEKDISAASAKPNEETPGLKNGNSEEEDKRDNLGVHSNGSSDLKSACLNGLDNHVEEGDEKKQQSVERPIPGKVISDEHRLELVLLLRELCNYAHSLQPDQRGEFLKRLNDYKICAVIEQLLSLESLDIRQAAIDIFASLVDFSPSLIRDYALHAASSEEANGQPTPEDGLLSLVIAELLNDSDPELGSAFHLANLLRLILDPDNMIPSWNRTEKVDFLAMFYKDCMHSLVAPLLAVTADGKKPSRDDYKTALQLNLIVELLTFCLEVHGPHIRRYIISRDLIRRVLVLLKSRHAMLVLSSLRFFRRAIGLKDVSYTEHVISNHLFDPIVDGMLANSRDNMLQSAFHDLFQFIRNEAIDECICHLVERFDDRLPPNTDRPDFLGTFTWMRERAVTIREQAASTPRQIAVVSPEPMPSPTSNWTSANSRAQLHYASGGISQSGISSFMRIGMSNGNSTGLVQSQQQQINGNSSAAPSNSAAPTLAANGPTRGNANGSSYLDDEDLDDEEKWFETDEPAQNSASTTDSAVIRQGGEGLADVPATADTNGGTENSEENDNKEDRPRSAPATQEEHDSEAMYDQLHNRMIEARRARDEEDDLLPTRATVASLPSLSGTTGGVKRASSALTISINVTPKTSPVASPSSSTTSIRTSLVDYESDSEEEANNSDDELDEGERKSKKKKGGSGGDDASLGDNNDEGSQTKRLRNSLSPVGDPVDAEVLKSTGDDENKSLLVTKFISTDESGESKAQEKVNETKEPTDETNS